MTSRIEHNNPIANGPLNLTYHYEMISDQSRVAPFEEAIRRIAKGKRVLESGTGTGILSLLAAKHGATAVYSTELDLNVAAFARSNFERNGLSNMHLIQKSTTSLTLEDLDNQKVDLVIAENLSTWQVTEPEVQVMNHITHALANPHAIRLPSIMKNMVELVGTNFNFYDLVELRTHYFEFTGIPKATSFSNSELFSKFDFREICPEQISKSIPIEATRDGTINALRLTSPLVIYEDIEFQASDSLMPPVIVPLPHDISVRAGDRLEVHISYATKSNWESVRVTARKL